MLRTPMKILQTQMQQACSNGRCRYLAENGLQNLSDNPRHEIFLVVEEDGGAEVKDFADKTPLEVLMRNLEDEERPGKDGKMVKEKINVRDPWRIAVKCAACKSVITKLMCMDTKELLYNQLRDLVTHDKTLPLLYDAYAPPQRDRIPPDAIVVCQDAHRFDAALLTDQVLDLISASLKNGKVREALNKKMKAKEDVHQDPFETYTRIGVGLKALGEVTSILEMWPLHHKSPKHQHGGCAGSVRVMTGHIEVVLFNNLATQHPIWWENGDGHLYDIPQGQRLTWLTLKPNQTTWMNRSNWFCHTVRTPNVDENKRGYALSLHVYKSCRDEFEFIQTDLQKQAAGDRNFSVNVKKNPANDFFWNIDLDENDPRIRVDNVPDFMEAIGYQRGYKVIPSVVGEDEKSIKMRELYKTIEEKNRVIDELKASHFGLKKDNLSLHKALPNIWQFQRDDGSWKSMPIETSKDIQKNITEKRLMTFELRSGVENYMFMFEAAKAKQTPNGPDYDEGRQFNFRSQTYRNIRKAPLDLYQTNLQIT